MLYLSGRRSPVKRAILKNKLANGDITNYRSAGHWSNATPAHEMPGWQLLQPGKLKDNMTSSEPPHLTYLSDIPKHPSFTPKDPAPTDQQTCTKPALSICYSKAPERLQCQTLQIWQISSTYVKFFKKQPFNMYER